MGKKFLCKPSRSYATVATCGNSWYFMKHVRLVIVRLASQAKHIFYVKDSANPKWSVVLTSPRRTIEEDFFEDEIGDMLLECGYGVVQKMPNVDTPHEIDDTT